MERTTTYSTISSCTCAPICRIVSLILCSNVAGEMPSSLVTSISSVNFNSFTAALNGKKMLCFTSAMRLAGILDTTRRTRL